MRKRFTLITVTGALFLLILVMDGCKRATPQAAEVPSLSPSITVVGEASTATSTAGQAYPRPSLPPTASLIIPYPLPPTEIVYPPPAGSTSPSYQAPQASSTQVATSHPEATQTQLQASLTPTGTATATTTATGTATATITAISGYPGPQVTGTIISGYPGPQPNTPGYPGPQFTNTVTSPRQATATPKPSRTPSRSVSPTSPTRGTILPSPSPMLQTGTPQATPTELPPRPPLSPPPAGSNVSIWYAWGITETETLRTIIQSFQKLYPDVTFSLDHIPMDDLFNTYVEAAYAGQGPSLLLGPAGWGPELFSGQLVADLSAFVPAGYLSGINPAALGSGRYNAALVSLPLAQDGMVMYRNTSIIPTAPKTFNQLVELSHAATHAGIVGSYLERGAYFSSATLLGLGGSLMNDDLQPTFDDHYGLEWMNLLTAYAQAGAVTFNTNRDLDLFKRGRVGMIIDGTWNLAALTEAIGADQLAIDPWPAYGSGHLSGWVEADSVFLNANVTGSARFAALAFISYLLDPNVQLRLAEVGHIPSVVGTTPRDPLILQAMQAFSGGVTYPIAVDDSTLSLYWNELNNAIHDVFVSGIDPKEALKAASDDISLILLNSTPAP